MKKVGFKISDLKKITPDASYKENAKKRFLNSVRSTSFSENKNTYKNPIIVPLAFKRIAVSFATFSFVFAVCGSVVYSASDDLPGDFLYPVKIATEKVRFVFTFSPEDKMDLELEIASKRFAEFSQYLDSSSETLSDPKSKKAVASVFSEIDVSIIRLSSKIDNMNNDKSTSSDVVITARMIGDRIGEYNKTLIDTRDKVSDEDVKDAIDKVEMSNNKVAIRALKIAASHVEKNNVDASERDEIISSVSSRAIAKIDDIQNSVSDDIVWDELVLEGKKEESVKIKERLEDAKRLLASADVDLSYALQVVEDIITEHENFLNNNVGTGQEVCPDGTELEIGQESCPVPTESENIENVDNSSSPEGENNDIITDNDLELEENNEEIDVLGENDNNDVVEENDNVEDSNVLPDDEENNDVIEENIEIDVIIE
ncbi:MAG: hypothetical protein EOL97_15415 [Spirochaetia bacterium]|nr:hypothetical protein [Spirochaetia bacterium]